MSTKTYAIRHKQLGLCINCPKPLVEGSKIFCEYHRTKSRAQGRIKNRRLAAKLKMECLSAYGNRCACCGETKMQFLSIDHKSGKGNIHRKFLFKHNVGGEHMYRWLRQNKYPGGFGILCMNCNWATRYGGVCPHKIVI